MRALFLSLVIGLCIMSCERPPKHSDIPTLEFREITATPNFAKAYIRTDIDIKLYFTDGTGDLGLYPEETTGIYKSVIDTKRIDTTLYTKYSRNYMNYWIDMYVKREGVYTLIKSTEEYHKRAENFYGKDGRFRPFNSNFASNPSPIEGFLNFKLQLETPDSPAEVTRRPLIEEGDSMLFKIRILDRKLNISNEVTTTPIQILVP